MNSLPRRKIANLVILTSLSLTLIMPTASAGASPVANETNPGAAAVVVQAVQAGSSGGAKYEAITIKNTGATNVDVTNWQLIYQSGSGKTSKTLVNFSTGDMGHLYLKTGAAETLISNEYASYMASQGAVFPVGVYTFSGGLSAKAGSVVLRDAKGLAVDTVGWGALQANDLENTSLYEATRTEAIPSDSILLRIGDDTDNNATDFSVRSSDELEVQLGAITTIIDMCSNIEGVQPFVPQDMVRDSDGSCTQPDACANIAGVQAAIPEGYQANSDGTCTQIDVCPNIEGIQAALGQYELVAGECVVPFTPAELSMTELLPNPDGYDTGREYIEIYNAEDFAVNLDDYYLRVGEKTYAFAKGSVIGAESFMAIYDDASGVVLANTNGRGVELIGRDGEMIDETPIYPDAPVDQAWALIDETWQYTSLPTPGAANTPSPIVESRKDDAVGRSLTPCPKGKYRNPASNRCKSISAAKDSLKPCGSGEYRNPSTNRCKKLASNTSSLKPCGPGQYRNPATNRCKSLASASSSLKPCGPGEYRNPATNRCKKLASSSSSLKPCKPGYERNPETNRCRKVAVAGASAPVVDFPVQEVKEGTKAFVGWWVLGGLLILGAGYATFEWRHEIAAATRTLRTKVSSKGK